MDKREFAEQVEAVKQQLYKTAYLYMHNEASALEAVDESIYKALKSLKTLRQPEYFTTWLTRILINECKKELKRLSRVSPAEYLPFEEGEDAAYDALPLKEAIGRLPEELRAVVGEVEPTAAGCFDLERYGRDLLKQRGYTQTADGGAYILGPRAQTQVPTQIQQM